MKYLLDTNACIGVLTNRVAPLVDRWKRTVPSQVRLCSVVKAELLFGAEKSARRELVQQQLQRFFSRFKSNPSTMQPRRPTGSFGPRSRMMASRSVPTTCSLPPLRSPMG